MAETVVRSGAKDSHPGIAARAFKTLGHAVNPLLLPLAGTGLLPIWGLVQHRGRRSQRLYLTPVAIFATAQGFVIPLPFGESTDWCRNLIAAGGGVVKWKKVEYPVTAPEVVTMAAAIDAFPKLTRPFVRAFGISRALLLQRQVRDSTAS